MKYLSILLLTFSLCANAGNQQQFCKGYKQGYISAYMRAANTLIKPYPQCPFQPMKSYSDPKSDFEHGYLIGAQRGMIAARAGMY